MIDQKQMDEWRKVCEKCKEAGIWHVTSACFPAREALPKVLDELERLEADSKQLEALRAQNYRITVTIEATAPAAAHSFCGKGSTVAEAVRSLGEMMNKAKEAK